MPVGRIVGGKSPGDRFPGQTRFHVDVVSYILVVIVIDKRVVVHRKVQRDGRHHDEKDEKKYPPTGLSKPAQVAANVNALPSFLLVPGSRTRRSQFPLLTSPIIVGSGWRTVIGCRCRIEAAKTTRQRSPAPPAEAGKNALLPGFQQSRPPILGT